MRIDNFSKVFSYEIRLPNVTYFVVGNFNNDSGGTWLDFPGTAQTYWKEVMNSSEPKYGGDDEVYQNIISNVGGRKNLLRLKGPGFYMFKSESTPSVKNPLYFRTDAQNWAATEANMLKANPANADELTTRVEFTKAQNIEFKLGTKNWEVDLGKVADAKLNKERMQDMLTYIPYSANIKTQVNPGKYLFKFNLRTYSYSFEKL